MHYLRKSQNRYSDGETTNYSKLSQMLSKKPDSESQKLVGKGSHAEHCVTSFAL